MDYRKRVTHKIVEEAMIELLEEKPLHKIKVKELCEKAGINRATFYNNYEDIYDLYEKLEEEFFNQYYEMISPKEMYHNPLEIKASMERFIKYFIDNKRLFMIFYRSDRCSLLLEKVMKKETKWMTTFEEYSRWEKDETIAFDNEEELFMMNLFAINGNFGLLYYLFSSGKDVDPKEFAELMQKFYYKKMLVK